MATSEEGTSCKSINQKYEAAVPECTMDRWQAEESQDTIKSSELARHTKEQAETNFELERALEDTKRCLEESESSREKLHDEKEELERINNSLHLSSWYDVSVCGKIFVCFALWYPRGILH